MIEKAIVLDANILIRAVLGQKVRELVFAHAKTVQFFAPDVAYADARKYLPAILGRRGVAPEPAMTVLDRLEAVVRPLGASLPCNQTLHFSPCKVLHARTGNPWLRFRAFGRSGGSRMGVEGAQPPAAALHRACRRHGRTAVRTVFFCGSKGNIASHAGKIEQRARGTPTHQAPTTPQQAQRGSEMTDQGKKARLPAGSWDCHVHVYGPFDRFPAATEGKFAPRQEFTVEDLFEQWDEHGISKGVIVHPSNGGEDNAVTCDALRRYPDRLRAVAVLEGGEISEKRLDELTEAGFRGLRVNMLRQDGAPVSGGGTTYEDLRRLAPRLAARGWHAQLWIETGDLDDMASELEQLPLDFVIDHMGRTMVDKGVGYPGFRGFCERLQTGRYWCKLSGADRNTRQGAPYDDVDEFMRALVAANPERLVWGTDWPHVGHGPESVPVISTLIDVLERCVPDQALRHRILVENPAKLYGG